MKKLCLAFIFICFPSIGTVNDEDFVYNDYHEIIHDVAELTWGGYQENALTVFDDNDYDCNTNVADDDPSMDNDNRNWDVNATAIKDDNGMNDKDSSNEEDNENCNDNDFDNA